MGTFIEFDWLVQRVPTFHPLIVIHIMWVGLFCVSSLGIFLNLSAIVLSLYTSAYIEPILILNLNTINYTIIILWNNSLTLISFSIIRICQSMRRHGRSNVNLDMVRIVLVFQQIYKLFCLDFIYIQILLFQFWHFASVNVRLS